MADAEICLETITSLAPKLSGGELSPLELVRAVLARIGEVDARLNSYVHVTEEAALAAAGRCEREIADGKYRGPLHGVPIAVKDLCSTEGVATTCASKVLAAHVPDHDATVVARLRAAGAVIVGKLNMTEFAYAGYHPELAAPVNAWGENHWPGLSSSGSGAAVAAGLCFAATGTDTGGSIRYPSAANGVVGIKPTYGRVSRYGVFPLSHTLDHIGPMARSVADAALVLQAIAGEDPNDPTSLCEPVPDYAAMLSRDLRGIRVGIDVSYCTAGVVAEVSEAVLTAVELMGELGAAVREISLPSFEEAGAVWSTIGSVDAGLAHQATFPSRADDYGPAMRSLLDGAADVTAADYAQALIVKERLTRSMEKVYADVDVLACPAQAAPAQPVTDRTMEIDHVMGAFQFTAPYNLTGQPSVTLPCGFSAGGMPIALQLVGQRLDEKRLCDVAHAYEQATDWHRCHPELPAG